MICEKITLWLRIEREKIKQLSPRKKWEYIWTYYKWWILGAVLLVCIVISGVHNAQYQKKHLLLNGIFINTSTSADGYAYVRENYWTYSGANPDTRVELTEARSIRYNVAQPTSTDVNLVMSIDTMIAAGDLDYIIGDLSAAEFYDRQGSLLDLNTIFSPQQLAQWNYITADRGTIAIDLTGSSLHRKFGLYTEPSYIMILVNTAHPEQCADFIQYLFHE